MAADAILTRDQLIAQRRQALAQTPPILPLDWNATFILSPFGDATPRMNNYDQLVIADVTCFNDFIAGNGMRVSLYLLEELQYFDFAFSGGQWYWLESQPGQEPTNYAGPFPTSLQPLNVGLLAQAVYGGQWAVAGTLTDGWVVPTQNVQPQHGNWYSLRSEDRILWRVLNVDSNNPLNVPILGAYFMANVSNYTPLPAYLLPPPFVKMLREGKGRAVAGAQSPLVTQRDIQSAMANPIFSASCTLQQIQALVPGITPLPTPMPPLPAWTDQVYIRGWTLGGDYFPYYTQVWYDYTIPCQRSEFIGFGNNVGQNTYNDRQDTVLYANYTNNPVYQWQGPPISAWQFNCCNPQLQGVGVPVPNFLQAANGTIKATITGNPSFGLAADETLLITRATMPRDPDPDPILSVFWLWFTADSTGVFFSECNYVDPLDHELFTIDYDYFERNASNRINSSTFGDPCAQANAPACPTSSARMAAQKGNGRRPFAVTAKKT
jgi:hypothetical protein